MRNISALLLSALAVAGCATPRADSQAVEDSPRRAGAVGFQDISGLASAPGGRVALAPNEAYLEPLEAVGSPLPRYPSQLLSARLDAQTVCVRLAIDADGKITGRTPVVEDPACPAASDPAFWDSVSSTLARWTFEPARRCVFPTVAMKEMTNASCSGGQEIPIAVSVTYRFVFEQRDGHGSVRMGM